MLSVFKPRVTSAALIATDQNMGMSLAKMLSHDGISLDVPVAFDKFLNLGPRGISSYDILFIDMSSMSDVRDVVGSLMDMRLEYRSLPVVLISSDFGSDDFGTSRRSVCDVSLRDPFYTPSIEIACRQAVLNNLKWQEFMSVELSAQAA